MNNLMNTKTRHIQSNVLTCSTLLVGLLFIGCQSNPSGTANGEDSAASTTGTAESSPPEASREDSIIRIRAGSTEPYTDAAGNVADTHDATDRYQGYDGAMGIRVRCV